MSMIYAGFQENNGKFDFIYKAPLDDGENIACEVMMYGKKVKFYDIPYGDTMCIVDIPTDSSVYYINNGYMHSVDIAGTVRPMNHQGKKITLDFGDSTVYVFNSNPKNIIYLNHKRVN